VKLLNGGENLFKNLDILVTLDSSIKIYLLKNQNVVKEIQESLRIFLKKK
jgi:hypothetical protein